MYAALAVLVAVAAIIDNYRDRPIPSYICMDMVYQLIVAFYTPSLMQVKSRLAMAQ